MTENQCKEVAVSIIEWLTSDCVVMFESRQVYGIVCSPKVRLCLDEDESVDLESQAMDSIVVYKSLGSAKTLTMAKHGSQVSDNGSVGICHG